MVQRVALITGSGRQRVGNAIARALGDDGFALALHYHTSRAEANATVDTLSDVGVVCEPFAADIRDEEQVQSMFDSVIDRFGRLDLLVTTASIWESRSLEETSAEELRRSFDVNTVGTFLCARNAGLVMSHQEDGGVIVTMGDWAISRPYLNHAAYFIAKGAIPTLTRTLAVEFAHRNRKVRVNCIHPGPVLFPEDCDASERQSLCESTLVDGANDPRAIVEAIRFFVASPFVTGVCLPVDGGRSIYAGESRDRQRPI